MDRAGTSERNRLLEREPSDDHAASRDIGGQDRALDGGALKVRQVLTGDLPWFDTDNGGLDRLRVRIV